MRISTLNGLLDTLFLRGLILACCFLVLDAQAKDISATLSCQIQWTAETNPVDLNSSDRCSETCKVSLAGPEGVSFTGETSSASRIKLTVSSMTKNESLIFVKEFDYSQVPGNCATGEILKDSAKGHCTVCVKP